MAKQKTRRPPRKRRTKRRSAGTPTAVYSGTFGRAQAERLLWRAGFGPKPGQADEFAALGVRGAVERLLHPPSQGLTGPGPTNGKGGGLAPQHMWGHDHLWWLDRMVRADAPLVERMTLIWHDWFATSRAGVPTAKLMLDQNQLLREHSMGTFRELTVRITKDPAMLIWLSGAANTAQAPNENYARELMELFTLGANASYTERDVREQARALTGWRADWRSTGPANFRFDRRLHDPGRKRVFRRAGDYDWRDAVQLCLDHGAHPGFLVRKLWSYFIPTPPDAATEKALAALYVQSGTEIRPVLEAILLHPALHEGPRMVKPPVVHVAGMLRALGRGVDTDSWVWLNSNAGQQLFVPPNVSGWDDQRWLDTATWRGRWHAVTHAMVPWELKDDLAYLQQIGGTETPEQAVDRALAFWGTPAITDATRGQLIAFATDCERMATHAWKKKQYPRLRQNALRQLIATSPDYQTS
ncbi:MAG: DUF1800 domain-containing protein [Solirubrobacteraceae bacterium]|nr:DUF1800 domain-containing protein [Solirubrobacteraceae bacterium]